MKPVKLYRKRLIPKECIWLKDDEILFQDSHIIVTRWNTLKPKKTLHHGISCYYLDYGYKVSKFYDKDNVFLSWYCDIIETDYNDSENTYIFTDLLADVIIYPNGFVKVVDLDELSFALEEGSLSIQQLKNALRILDTLLGRIYNGKLEQTKKYIEQFE